ncbi:AAA family ATPase [Mycolicibacterium flavescens]|uniref:AAA family ATPase n=1 Tax=Mycolicibacterium flavescens TaxID=1776 RepID=A0A1E3REQ2_MYCFV|nr:septum site-determining protein Ssd [Mycolicibacterium flavescens]ODQ88350.1 AAA family ATPase [Mycolicibacterium flavescens]
MTSFPGLLCLIGDPTLCEEVDRVGAAAGITAVHTGEPSNRRVWSSAVAVVCDVAAAQHCATRALPRRPHVVLVADREPDAAHWQAAIAVGAQRVVTLPAQDGVLMAELADAAEALRDVADRGAVVSVMAGRGGAGATIFAAALARVAGRQNPDALLIDADPWSGGIDLVLGAESESGLRWPELQLGRGRVDYAALRDALPHAQGVGVLSAGRGGAGRGGEVAADPLAAVIDAGSRGGATVVCDVPRRPVATVETAVAAADLTVLMTTADVRSAAASASVAAWITAINPNCGVVVRGPAPGGLGSSEIADIVGLPLLAAMRPQPGVAKHLEQGGLRIRRWSPLADAAGKVLSVLRRHPAEEAA